MSKIMEKSHKFLIKKYLLLTLVVINLIWHLQLSASSLSHMTSNYFKSRANKSEFSIDEALLETLVIGLIGMVVYLCEFASILWEDLTMLTIFSVLESIFVLMLLVLSWSSYPVFWLKTVLEMALIVLMMEYWADLYGKSLRISSDEEKKGDEESDKRVEHHRVEPGVGSVKSKVIYAKERVRIE